MSDNNQTATPVRKCVRQSLGHSQYYTKQVAHTHAYYMEILLEQYMKAYFYSYVYCMIFFNITPIVFNTFLTNRFL